MLKSLTYNFSSTFSISWGIKVSLHLCPLIRISHFNMIENCMLPVCRGPTVTQTVLFEPPLWAEGKIPHTSWRRNSSGKHYVSSRSVGDMFWTWKHIFLNKVVQNFRWDNGLCTSNSAKQAKGFFLWCYKGINL